MTAPIEAAIKDLKYFNSHPHEEDDAAMKEATYFTCIFQLTSSRRGWLFHIHLSCSSISISTHILTKRMTMVCGDHVGLSTFQLTSSRRGWLYSGISWVGETYFNSHPHVEDDERGAYAEKERSISTHILTKRMTRGWRDGSCGQKISTHILTKRMTFLSCRSVHSFCNISTHILTKRMTESVFRLPVFPCISTHILTKRMTLRTLMLPILRVYFNSHPHEEDDGLCFPLGLLNWYFNSHPHEEDDLRNDGTANRSDISTHILTKRMTRTKPCRIPRH